jgi:hypothetical protein
MRQVWITTIFLFALPHLAQGQQDQMPQPGPTALIEQLRTALLARQSVAQFLTPELSQEQRQKMAESEMRPYLTFTILYNAADLVQKDPNHAEIAVLIQWQTATTTFNGARVVRCKMVRHKLGRFTL